VVVTAGGGAAAGVSDLAAVLPFAAILAAALALISAIMRARFSSALSSDAASTASAGAEFAACVSSAGDWPVALPLKSLGSFSLSKRNLRFK
jgi:hypothetical protein